jgi:two-component system response regulator AlgR
MKEPALRVAITDDEALARHRLRDLLADCAETIAVEIVGEASNGRDLLELVALHPVDVVLLDIRMPEMDGIEVAQHLMKLPAPPAVIFTTAYDAYAIRAFELHAVDYLLKPIRAQRLAEALKRAKPTGAESEIFTKLATRARTHLSVHERGRVNLIPVTDILFLRAELKYVTVRVGDREHLIEESLTRLEQEFNDQFIRIHRNCLVARSAVAGFERAVGDGGEAHWVVLLRGLEEKLPVSRRQNHVVKELGRGGAQV